VAAYPVTGPIDIVGDGFGGVVSENLEDAALAALEVDREQARQRALRYTWKACAEMFMDVVHEALGKGGAPTVNLVRPVGGNLGQPSAS
jgi:glycosyltransferase involved in cell wall biosynthesis